MSELSAYKRGAKGKERMSSEVRKLSEAIANRNEQILALRALAQTLVDSLDSFNVMLADPAYDFGELLEEYYKISKSALALAAFMGVTPGGEPPC